MSLKLDDLFGKKKEVAQVLDLSKAVANNADEFRRIMEKVPDFKIKPEKMKSDFKIQDRPKKRSRKKKPATKYQFANPIPQEMRSLQLKDLCSVPIQWNMLTNLRPKSKIEEEYYSRLVELGKLHLTTVQKERKIGVTDFLKKMKNRSGIVETRFLSCLECGEDFCQSEVCNRFSYDDFRRKRLPEDTDRREGESLKKPKPKRNRIKKKNSVRLKRKGTLSDGTSRKRSSRAKDISDKEFPTKEGTHIRKELKIKVKKDLSSDTDGERKKSRTVKTKSKRKARIGSCSSNRQSPGSRDNLQSNTKNKMYTHKMQNELISNNIPKKTI